MSPTYKQCSNTNHKVPELHVKTLRNSLGRKDTQKHVSNDYYQQ